MDIEEAKEQLLKHKKEIDAKFISARYSKAIEVVLSELDKKDKIIDLMAEQLTTPVHNKKWVIDYFEKKAEGN